MNNPKYQYKSEQKLRHFEFISEEPKGLIHKLVEYTETGQENVFNLAFGDYDKTTKSIDDLSITNNGDSLKVLATVASTVYAFTESIPNRGFLQLGVPVRELAFTEWESRTIFPRFKRTSWYLD